MFRLSVSNHRIQSAGRSGQGWRTLAACILPALFMAVAACGLVSTAAAAIHEAAPALQAKYQDALAGDWEEVFRDSGAEDWNEKWFVDGFKATLKNTPEGMYYAAGPTEHDNASHAVLWTRDSFEGDLKVEFDYVRLDTINRFVNLLYLYATGTGAEPYAEDIQRWTQLRSVPYMRTYFDNMNLLHISFAAFDNHPRADKDSAYIRARRYPRALFDGDFNAMALEPDYLARGLFEPAVPHHITVIRKGDDLFFNVSNPAEERLFHWDLSQKPDLQKGRIGLRHMWQRAGLYKDFTVSQSATKEAAPAAAHQAE